MGTRVRIFGALVLASCPGLAAAPPQDPPAEKPKEAARTQRIEAWIAGLGSERPEERDAAMRELRKVGVPEIPLLKRAYKESQDAEVRARLELLLSDLDPPDLSTFFEVRRAARRSSSAWRGDSEAAHLAVNAALRWLARHQDPDGGWGAQLFESRCSGAKCGGAGDRDFDIGVSALAILAFLGAGYTQDSRDELPPLVLQKSGSKPGDVVRSGLQGLLSRQDSDGCIGVRGMKYMYGHAIATLALVEAYGMTRADFLRIPTQKAVDFLVAAQNPGKGWRYSTRCGDNDSSVTGWAAQALALAQIASLRVPPEAAEGAVAWYDEAMEVNGYLQVGYNARSTGKVFIPGKNEDFEHHATMSAAGSVARIFLQKRTSDPCSGAANLLLADKPAWKKNAIDFYYWYYGSLALHQFDGREGGLWMRWHAAVVHALVPNQSGDGCTAGSWDPSEERWGFAGGRVYATALNALTLETDSRYPVIPSMKWPSRR